MKNVLLRAFPGRSSRVGRALIAVAALHHFLDPSGVLGALRTRKVLRPRLVVTCVYRTRNVSHVLDLRRRLKFGDEILLWALDDVADDLREYTIGQGAGARLALHERLLSESRSPQEFLWMMVDDDVDYATFDLELFARLFVATQSDVAGPAHRLDSYINHLHTLARFLTFARQSPFVEIGPIVAFSHRARVQLLPFPATTVAAWGFEAFWSSVTHPSLNSVLIDATPIRHLEPAGKSYDSNAELVNSFVESDKVGISNWYDLQRTISAWRCWSKFPC